MKRIALGLMALALLAGCGIKSGLERPDPMWNREEALARERQQAARENEVARRRNQTPTESAGAQARLPADTNTDPASTNPIAPPQMQ